MSNEKQYTIMTKGHTINDLIYTYKGVRFQLPWAKLTLDGFQFNF